MNEFVTADSGERLEFDSGMKRDTADGKVNYLLVRPGPMLRRWAELMTRGSVKYESDRKPGELRNWQKASGEAEYERFLESAARHFEHWLNGTNEIGPDGEPIVEDHAAGVFFNINGAEYVRAKSVELTEPAPEPVGISEAHAQMLRATFGPKKLCRLDGGPLCTEADECAALGYCLGSL